LHDNKSAKINGLSDVVPLSFFLQDIPSARAQIITETIAFIKLYFNNVQQI